MENEVFAFSRLGRYHSTVQVGKDHVPERNPVINVQIAPSKVSCMANVSIRRYKKIPEESRFLSKHEYQQDSRKQCSSSVVYPGSSYHSPFEIQLSP